jgi:hypothetical protein
MVSNEEIEDRLLRSLAAKKMTLNNSILSTCRDVLRLKESANPSSSYLR